MIALIGQIVGCLLVAAGIGGVARMDAATTIPQPTHTPIHECHRRPAPQRTDAGEGAV